MTIPIMLAHGALGWADEIIFGGVVVVFLGLMLVQWAKTRAEGDKPSTEPITTDTDEAPDRFQLD